MAQQQDQLLANAHTIRAIVKQPTSAAGLPVAELTQILKCTRLDLPQSRLLHRQFSEWAHVIPAT
jgi:hypothetical protein